jgi:tripartite-type tricarboxylate transporter receptor subunit TctC
MLKPVRLAIVFSLVLLQYSPASLSQENYPSGPVKVIVTFTAGGGADFMGRILSQKLGEILKQPFIVDNKLGASGIIGAQFVAQSKPDGYTLLLGTTGTHSTNFATIPSLPYHPIKDFTTIAIFSDAPYLLCINPELGINSIPQLVRYAKANPGKLTFGSSGIGSSPHLGFEALKSTLGIDVTHIPYKGLPAAMVDVMGGQISMTYDSIPSAVPHMKAGKVKCIAIGSKERSPVLPEIPTISEASGTNFVMGSWYGLFGPKDLPLNVTNRLSTAILQSLKDPEFQASLQRVGATAMPLNPNQSKNFLESDINRWVNVANELQIRAQP